MDVVIIRRRMMRSIKGFWFAIIVAAFAAGCAGTSNSGNNVDTANSSDDKVNISDSNGMDLYRDISVATDLMKVDKVVNDERTDTQVDLSVAVDVIKDVNKEAGCTCNGENVCVDGKCKCPGTKADCDGVCTTLGTNSNCSGCGDECAGGKTCQDGQCRCPKSQVDCSGTCTMLETDTDCSGCGDECTGGKTCKNGRCVAKPDPNCLSSDPCVTNGDCQKGYRCNQAVKPPACQKLYCGTFGSACSGNEFCLSLVCGKDSDQCVPDCSNQECGPDPVYAESCGTCHGGRVCKSGQCVCKPKDLKSCRDTDVVWFDSCGRPREVITACPLACKNAKCVDCEAVGLTNCSGVCKPLGTNTDCSACGNECTGGKTCQGGQCTCPGSEVACSGICTALGTDTDCSKCGDKCAEGGHCQNGMCKCPGSQTDCSGTCTILGTDTNCSKCGDKCAEGGHCQFGRCRCPGRQTDCSGTCTILGTDTNCSKCGDVCTGGKTCQNGTCKCPGSDVVCSGICTALGTDTDCSGCGDVCTEGKTCQDDKCQHTIWKDPTTGYEWQIKNTYIGYQKAIDDCKNLDLEGGNWHLPTISELRTLIRGCPATVTGGTCKATDNCLESSCFDNSCQDCDESKGPGPNGVFGPGELNWPPDSTSWYWSSSSVAGNPTHAWVVIFAWGYVTNTDKNIGFAARCVRLGH